MSAKRNGGNGQSAGRDEAFDRWYQLHFDRIRILCARILRDPAAAEDMAQEALLRAWVRRDQMREEDLGAWLSVVARNLCLSAMRGNGRVVVTDELPERIDLGCDPATEVVRRESRRNVRRAMAKLGDRNRRVIYLREVREAEYDEIGSEFGVTTEGARSIAFRARRALREHLAAVGEGFSGVLVGVRVRVRGLWMRARESVRVMDAGAGPALQVGMNLALAVGVSLATIGGAASYAGTRAGPSAVSLRPALAVVGTGLGGSGSAVPVTQHSTGSAGGAPAAPLGLPKPKLDGTPYDYKDGSSNVLFQFGPIAIESEDHRGTPTDPHDGFEPVYRPVDAVFAVVCANAPSACVPLGGDTE